MSWDTLAVSAAVLILLTTTYLLYIIWLRSKYPPGPWHLPILGNLLQLSPMLHVDLAKLAKRYGPVFTIWMGQRPTVVISNIHFAKEAFVDKGMIFGGRSMDTHTIAAISKGNEDLVTRSIDDKVIVMRKIALSVIRPKATGVISVHAIVSNEAEAFLNDVKRMNGKLFNPQEHVKFAISNVILNLLLNIRCENHDDPIYQGWTKLGETILMAVRKGTIADFYPVFWYFQPSVRRYASKAVQVMDDFINPWVSYHERTYQDGVIRDLTDMILKKKRELDITGPSSKQLSSINVQQLVLNILGGGSETTIDTILWTFLAMLKTAGVQTKLQNELDAFVSRENRLHSKHLNDLPTDQQMEHQGMKVLITYHDKPHLPYLLALVHESLRRCPSVPLGVPRKTMKDTSLGSHSIPANTAVFFNSYAIHMDEKEWKDPYHYSPERFLNSDGKFDSETAKKLIAFGTGPRSCVGENLGRIELFVFLGNIFLNYEISCPDVEKLPSLEEGLLGLTFSPKPFEIILKCRQPTPINGL